VGCPIYFIHSFPPDRRFGGGNLLWVAPDKSGNYKMLFEKLEEQKGGKLIQRWYLPVPVKEVGDVL
jgi:hypothetical protein